MILHVLFGTIHLINNGSTHWCWID